MSSRSPSCVSSRSFWWYSDRLHLRSFPTRRSSDLRLFLLVLILLLMPTLNFLPVWFALSLLRFRLPSRLPKNLGSASKRSEERFSRNAETELVCRLLREKQKSECSTLRRSWQ